jgi:hypothetical protein
MENNKTHIISRLHEYSRELKERNDRILSLAEKIGYDSLSTMGDESIRLLVYFSFVQSINPNGRLQYIHFSLKEALPIQQVPEYHSIILMTDPYSKLVDENGYLNDKSSNDLVAKYDLDWISFELYEQTYFKIKDKWKVVLRNKNNRNIEDLLDVDSFFIYLSQ